MGPGWASLAPHPQLAALSDIIGAKMPPPALLAALSARGLHLLPEDRDARCAGVVAKARGVEDAMCADLALLGGAFLIARSKWNQVRAGRGAGECERCGAHGVNWVWK